MEAKTSEAEGLSRARLSAQEMGAIGAELLLRLVAGQKPRCKTVLITPGLALRGAAMARSAAATSRSPMGESNHGKL
jgi:DNA-binding LacI/PurR family transcriptional regulator